MRSVYSESSAFSIEDGQQGWEDTALRFYFSIFFSLEFRWDIGLGTSLFPSHLSRMRRAVSMEFENVLFPKHLRKSLCVVPAARVEGGWVSFSRAVEQLEPQRAF